MAPSGDDSVAKSHCSEGPCAHLPQPLCSLTNFGTTEHGFPPYSSRWLSHEASASKASAVMVSGPSGDAQGVALRAVWLGVLELPTPPARRRTRADREAVLG